MASARNDKTTVEAQRIAAMEPGRLQERAVSRFHRDNYRLYEQIAVRFRTSAGVSINEIDDLTQVVAMVADSLIRDPKHLSTGNLFASTLRRFSSSKLRDWSFSSENTGIAGASGARRREMTVAQVYPSLKTSLGREPTTAEIIDAANEEMSMRRSNPTKGGRITERDVHGLRMLPTDFDAELAGGFGGAVLPVDGVLDPTEMAPFATLVVEACFHHGADLGRLSELYLEPFLKENAAPDRTVKELSAEVGRNTDWVRRSVHEINGIARDILREDFGISKIG